MKGYTSVGVNINVVQPYPHGEVEKEKVQMNEAKSYRVWVEARQSVRPD